MGRGGLAGGVDCDGLGWHDNHERQSLELNESTKCYGSATQELVSRTRASMRKKKKKSKGSASIFLIALALFTRLFIMLPNN